MTSSALPIAVAGASGRMGQMLIDAIRQSGDSALAGALNELLGQVQQSLAQQRRFISDAAHQLRTPLAGLKSQTELALAANADPALRLRLERVHESAVRGARLVSQLLVLARAEPEAVAAQGWAPVDCSALVNDVVADYVTAVGGVGLADGLDLEALWSELGQVYPIGITVQEVVASAGSRAAVTTGLLVEQLTSDAQHAYDRREAELGEEVMRDVERRVVLQVLDRKWREHLYEMDYLKEGIGLRAMAQREPLVEYQREGYQLFQAVMEAIKEESVRFLFHAEVTPAQQADAAPPQPLCHVMRIGRRQRGMRHPDLRAGPARIRALGRKGRAEQRPLRPVVATVAAALLPLLLPAEVRPPLFTHVGLVVFFAVTTLRAAALAGRRIRPMKVGLGELALSAVLTALVLTW